MKPLIFFSYGMTKCGSTLGFELVRTALEFYGYPQKKLTEGVIKQGEKKINFVQTIDADRQQNLIKEVNEVGHMIVLKTHRPPTPEVEELIRSGMAIGHAIYRDPRDMALSMVDHGARSRRSGEQAFSNFETIDDALVAVRKQVKTLQQWLSLPAIKPLYYDDIAFDSQACCQQLIADLGIDLSTPQASLLRRILVKLNLREPLQPNEDLSAQIVDHVLNRRFTQFNKGVQDRYKTEMSAEDSERIAAEFEPLISRLINDRKTLPNTQGPLLMGKDRLRVG